MVFLVLFLFELLLLFLLSRFLTSSLSKLLFRITKNQSLTISFLAILFLPGVILHELSHLLTAGVLFVPVGEIEFMPKVHKDGVKLGSVAIAKTDPIRRALIGFAPVIVGTTIILTLLFYATSSQSFFGLSNSLKLFLTVYILFEIGNTMFSSKKDVEGTLGLLVAIAIIGALLYIIGFRIPQEFVNAVFLKQNTMFVKQADILLLVPLAIDGAVVILTKFLIKK